MNKKANMKKETLVEKNIDELEDFFEIKLKSKPQIEFVDSREEMDMALGRKTEPWLVANADPENGLIHILSEDKFETESNHPREDFPRTLKHEISHNFYNQITGGVLPVWLNEGICLYLAKQIKNPPKEVNWDIDYYFDHADEGVYFYSALLVRYLIENYGKDKFLELISNLKAPLTKEGFNSAFETVYGFRMDNQKVKEIYESVK